MQRKHGNIGIMRGGALWVTGLGISSYDVQATILLHMSRHPHHLVLVVNDGLGGLQGWYEVGTEEEMWELIVEAEELGYAEVSGATMPTGVYEMPKRSEESGTLEFFHLLSEENQTPQQREV
jgi:hypothetical protein